MVPYSPILANISLQMASLQTPLYNESSVRWCANATDTENDKSYIKFYEIAQIITGLVIYPLVCFPGVVGNILTIFVLSRRNMQTSTNAFLSALAVADSIKLINDILYFFVIVFMRTSTRLGNMSYGYLYPYAHFVFSLSVCVSSWLTVSVAVERYIMVCHPTRARAMWSRRRAVILCTLIYVVMTSLALPSALRYRTIRCVDRATNVSKLDVELTEMWKNKLFVTSYTWTQNLLRSIIPLIVLVILNTCIISALRRTKAKRRKNARHRVTIMMIVVILAFLICITPDAILSTVFGFGYHEAGYLPRGIREITDTLLAINAGVNFLIYCAFNQVFRKSFAHICCPNTRQTNTWMTELDESTYRRLSEAKSLLMSNNNSPPRQDTPPTIVTDNSPTSYNGIANGRGGSLENSYDVKDDQIQEESETGNTKGSDSSSSDTSHQHGAQQNNSHTHQQHRTSSNGLKKSRNSIKCNRAKHRAHVMTCNETVETFRHGRTSESFSDYNDIEPDESSDSGSIENDDSGTGQANVPAAFYKASPGSSFYQNQLINKVCSCVNERHDVRTNSSDSLNDEEKLENLRTCNGARVNLSCGGSDANDLSKYKPCPDKTLKVCFKDRIQPRRKRHALSVSFTDSKDINKDPSNPRGENDNRVGNQSSGTPKDEERSSRKGGIRFDAVAAMVKEVPHAEITKDVGVKEDGDVTGSVNRLNSGGEILMTDL